MDRIKAVTLLAGISAAITTMTERYGILFWTLFVFAVAMILDYASGMLASKKEALEHPEDKEIGWSSRRGLIGIIKKFGYICIVAVSIMVDVVIMKSADLLHVQMDYHAFFAQLVTTWFILNECLSIIENAGRMGVVEIPAFLTKVIAALKGKVEDTGEKNTPGKK